MLVERKRTPLSFSKAQYSSLITLQRTGLEVCEHSCRKDSKKWHCSGNRHVCLMFPNILLNCHIYLHLHQHLGECTSSGLNIHVLNVFSLIHVQAPAPMPPPRIPGFPPPSCFISCTPPPKSPFAPDICGPPPSTHMEAPQDGGLVSFAGAPPVLR